MGFQRVHPVLLLWGKVKRCGEFRISEGSARDEVSEVLPHGFSYSARGGTKGLALEEQRER